MDKINIIKATPNFPFLEATIDGLSYYQLLAGLNAYINTVVDLINNTGIESWKETVDKISAQVNVLSTSVSANTASINSVINQIGTAELKTDEKTLIGAINELFATIASIETAIGNDNLTTTADTLIGAINELVTDIAGLNESSDEFKTDILNLKNSVTKNTNDISQLKTNVQTNTDDLATAKTDISQLKTSVQTNTDELATAKTDISQLTTKVGTSALATTSQNLSDAVNELKSAIGTGGEGEKTPVTSETTITVSGTTAVDAVQLNPNGVDGQGNDGLGNKTFAKKLEENSGVIENYDSRLTAVESSNATNAAAIAKANKDISNNTTSIDTANGKITKIETTVGTLTTDVNNAKSNISSLQEDSEMFSSDITTITNNIGKLTELTTTAKDTIVAAINEVNAKPSGGGGETTPISNATNITTEGTYALDAVQNNADVADTLRNLIVGLQSLYNTLSGNVTDLTSSVTTNTRNISSLNNTVSTNTNNIGTLSSLNTTAKNNLVSAINEVKSSASKTPISNATNVSTVGQYALDAVQNNPGYNNSLANKIQAININMPTASFNNVIIANKVWIDIYGRFYVINLYAIQLSAGTTYTINLGNIYTNYSGHVIKGVLCIPNTTNNTATVTLNPNSSSLILLATTAGTYSGQIICPYM